MTSQISKIVGKCSHHGIEKNNSTKELALNSSAVSELPKNNIVDLAIPSILQESLKQTARKFGLDDEFIHKIPRESLVSKETLAAYLFPEILDNLPHKSWETLNYKELFKLKDSEGMDIILTGIKRGKKEFLIYILQNSDKNLLMNFQDMNRRSMLHLAAIYGQDEIVTLFLSHHPDLVSLESKDSDGLTAFHWAMHEGHEKIIQKLLNYNLISQKWELQKHSVSTLALAVASKNPGTVSLLLQNNHFKEINLLQPISPFGSVLHLAILLNEPKMVSYLLQTACSKAQDLLEITDKANRTPLQLAAFLGDLFAIKELCKKGAPIHQGENTPFGTPLHWAVKGKQPEAISLLLSLNADPLKADQKGKTAILYLDNTDLETPLGKRCKNLLDNFMRSKRVEKIKEANFQERPPFNLIFEGNCTTFDGFIGLVQVLEAKKMIKDIRRCSGKGLGSIVAALLAIGYTASQLEDLPFKDLEDLLKQKTTLTDKQLQEIEALCLKPVSYLNSPPSFLVVCDITELRNDLEDVIFSKTNIKNLTLGQLKESVEASSHLYKHLHIPIYSFLKKQIIFFNTEDSRYGDFVLADVLAASLSFLGLLIPSVLRRKNLDENLYEDITYGKTCSIPFETPVVDQFDDLVYQEDPYFKGRMTNYRTCSLQLNQSSYPNSSSEPHLKLLSRLIIRHLNSQDSVHIEEKISVGRVKRIYISSEDLEDEIACIKNRAETLFSACSLDTVMQKNPQSLPTVQDKKSAWKFDIFRKNKKTIQQEIPEKEIKQLRTLPSFNLFFIGREKELKEIEDHFKTVKQVAICGLGGIGKSTLSLKYANCLQNYEFIHFIKATTVGSIKTGFLELAGLLGIKKDKIEETIAEFRVYLQRKDLKGLVIIDGLDEEAYFQELKDFIPPKSTCHILISTRIGEKAEVKGFKLVPLTSFTEKEAVYYLTKGLNVPLQEKTAAEILAKEIGCLPLALSHIARYLEQEKISLHQYENYFQKKTPKLPEKDAINLPDDEASVFITWQVSLDAIAKKDKGPLAINLMYFISTLGEEDVTFSLLMSWSNNLGAQYEELDVKIALKLLKDYAFLKEKKYEEDSNTYYNTHSLVQKVNIYQLKKENKEKEIIRDSIKVINQAIYQIRKPYREFTRRENYRLKNLYKVHLTNIFLFIQKEFFPDIEEQVKLLSHLSWLSGIYDLKTLNYIHQGLTLLENLEEPKKALMKVEFDMLKINLYGLDIQDKIHIAKKVLEVRSQIYEKDSEHIIECHEMLGGIYQNKEKYIEALWEYQKVLAWQKKNLNKKNKYIMQSYEQIIKSLKELGRKEEVLEVAQEMLKARKETLGEKAEETLESYKQVIEALKKLGRKEESIEVLKELLKARKEALGEGHVWTLESYKEVIEALQDLGRKEEALEIAKELLKARKEALGEGHVWTLESYKQVMETLKELGRKEEVLEVAQEMLEATKEVLTEKHIWTLESYEQVIKALKELGRKEEALEVTKELLKARKDTLGEGHAWTLESYKQVIETLKELRRKEAVLEVVQEMLKARKEALGESNRWTVESYEQVIEALKELGRKEEALEVAKNCLQARKEALGESNQWTTESYEQVIEALKELGRKEEALEVAKDCLKARKETLGESNQCTAESYELVIKALKELGRKEEVLEIAKNCLKAWKEILGEVHVWTVESYKQVIQALKNLGKEEEALEVAKDHLKARKEILGEEHMLTLASYKQVIQALKNLGKEEEALEVAKDHLKARKEILGEEHMLTLASYEQVIQALKNLGKEEEALEVAKDHLKARKEILGEEHMLTLASYEQVIQALKNLGKEEEVLEVAKKLLKVTKETLGEEDTRTLGSYEQVIQALKNLGREEEALAVAKDRLKARKEILGENNRRTVESYEQVIKALKGLGREEESLEVTKEMLKARKEALRESRKWALESYEQVIQALKKLEREKILRVKKNRLKGWKEALGQSESQILEENEMGVANYDDFIQNLRNEIQINKEYTEENFLISRKVMLEEECIWILESYEQIIKALKDLGRTKESLEVTQELLKTRKEAFGKRYMWALESYERVIQALKNLGKEEEALEVAKELLKITKETLGEEDNWALTSYAQVIQALKNLGKEEEALEVAKNFLQGFRRKQSGNY